MHELLKRFPIISDQVDASELTVVLRELEQVLSSNISGDVTEFGCYIGTTSLFLQRILRARTPQKTLHVYDSFAGLPSKTAYDASPAGEQFKLGTLVASKSGLTKHFKQAALPLPVIHKAWFADLMPTDLPAQICFAFLDGDFYESITQSLHLVWLRLAGGATVIVDDYQSAALPGVRRAVDEWLRSHPAELRAEASLAVIHIR
jgi:O-methyltransferase